jgi:hypothetical protein
MAGGGDKLTQMRMPDDDDGGFGWPIAAADF